MAHQIEEFDTIVSARGLVPWHRLGTVTTETLTTERCRELSGLSWNVARRQIVALPAQADDFVTYAERTLAAQQQRAPKPLSDPLDGFVALFRDDIWHPLGVVTDKYVPFQNNTLFEMLDPLIKEGTLTYETAGSLRNGRQVWVMCRFPQADRVFANGERVEGYLLITNSHDGSRGVIATPSIVRVVCANTMEAALRRGSLFSTAHVGAVADRVQIAVNMIAGATGEVEAMYDLFDTMQQSELNDEQLEAYYAAVFPDAPELAERAQEAVITRRSVCDRWRMASENQGIQGYNPRTLWAAYSSVTRFATHVVGARVQDPVDHQINGGGAQLRRTAYAAASELALAL